MSEKTKEEDYKDLSIAVVQNDYRDRGGADRVATELARTFDATIVTDRVRSDTVPSDIQVLTIEQGILSRLLEKLPVPIPHSIIMKWQHSQELQEFDVIISSNSSGTVYIPKDNQSTIHYIHSTPRIQSDRYQPDGAAWYKQVFVYFLDALTPHRRWPDVWTCNSEVTRRRLCRHWHVPREDVEVVYPPVPVDNFDSEYADNSNIVPDNRYFLYLGRLSNNKRIDEIINAFQSLPYPLLIAGEGEERGHLEQLATGHENITFLGRVTEEEKKQLLAGADAFIMNAAWENFGIATVEAFASGTPVIGVESGFTQSLIQQGKNGYCYQRGADNLISAVEKFQSEGTSWSNNEIEEFAERFGVDVFRDQMREMVNLAHKRTTPELSSYTKNK